ncbi:MAG TPA: AraC family transcriptional regulator [Polyangiaceae bacterium]|nr:AraC family transcriptional regulator [Polyangiaceae bacterium]
MVTRKDTLALALPAVSAIRLWSDELHTGMKEKYAIARVESGRSRWWSGGTVWDTSPGCLLLQQPGDVHRDVARDGPGVVQIISLSPSAVESVTGKIRVHPQLAANDERGAAFQRLHDAVNAGAERLALEVAVTEAIAALAALGDARLDRTRPVRRALELLEARLAEPVTLDELADHAAFDKFHLCRAFRAQVGLPPHAYLTRLRVMRAKELLAAGTKPSDVAARVGLYDQSQLGRHFRRIVGTTPGRYAAAARR